MFLAQHPNDTSGGLGGARNTSVVGVAFETRWDADQYGLEQVTGGQSNWPLDPTTSTQPAIFIEGSGKARVGEPSRPICSRESHEAFGGSGRRTCDAPVVLRGLLSCDGFCNYEESDQNDD
jgi:hypothetical protein